MNFLPSSIKIHEDKGFVFPDKPQNKHRGEAGHDAPFSSSVFPPFFVASQKEAGTLTDRPTGPDFYGSRIHTISPDEIE